MLDGSIYTKCPNMMPDKQMFSVWMLLQALGAAVA